MFYKHTVCLIKTVAGKDGSCRSGHRALTYVLPPLLGIFKWISWWGGGLSCKREVWLLQRRDWKRGCKGEMWGCGGEMWRDWKRGCKEEMWGGVAEKGWRHYGLQGRCGSPWPQLHPLPPSRGASHHERWDRMNWHLAKPNKYCFISNSTVKHRLCYEYGYTIIHYTLYNYPRHQVVEVFTQPRTDLMQVNISCEVHVGRWTE